MMTERFAMSRFRPNIVVKGSGVPFAEDMWRQIVLRPVEPTEASDETRTFTLVSKCTRCLVRLLIALPTNRTF